MTSTVVIVDDSLTVRMDLADAFRAEGFNPMLCATASEARKALARGAGVFVLDVLLPDGNGVDLLREIRESPAGESAVVVMLSSESEIKDRIRGLQTGADEYVGKPYDSAYLLAKVQQLLHDRQGSVQTGTTTVLVIDDSVTFREELRSTLESAGHHVMTASSGEEGLRIAGTRCPDAVVVDGQLPGIDGPTVIRRIRLDAALRHLPCLLLTASDDSDAELRALDAGADAFVRKEEDLEIMLVKLAALFRQTTARATGDEDARSLVGPKKILAVDGQPHYLRGLAQALTGEGYDVVPARSGAEALDLLAVQAVDCILLDSAVGDPDAEETCRLIKAAPIVRDIPLMMLGAVEDRDAMVRALAAGVDDYIAKSGEFGVLKARVRAQIRRKQFEDENRRLREEHLRREMVAAEARAARELAETRATLVEELERTNKELEAFTYSVSHDLRAPLRAVTGFSELLSAQFSDALPDGARQLVDYVVSAARRTEQLVDDLLLFSRMGRQPLVKSRVDVAGMIREIVEDLRRQQPGRSVDFRLATLPSGMADGSLLKQVLINLLSNAFKFTRHRDPAVIEAGAEQRPHEIEYYVRDNGAGFDAGYADRLFGVFQRLHRDEEFEGTGVGLSIVQQIVQRHGGRVWAEGAVDRGATFHFTLPL